MLSKSVQKGLVGVLSKSAKKKCQARVSSKSVKKECLAKNILKKNPVKISFQEFLARVFSKI